VKKIEFMKNEIFKDSFEDVLKPMYGSGEKRLEKEKKRYYGLLNDFEKAFPDITEAAFFSAPGRTEIGGNHTDHNAGHILAAAIDLDVLAVAGKCQNIITIKSEGYSQFSVDIEDLDPKKSEYGTSAALVRGVCKGMLERGYKIGGFCATITSSVLKGSGLSSSAAFEVEIANIINYFYNNGAIDPVTIAKIAQFAENEYFGKPCGLMDMCACAVGGCVMIDFKDFDNPIIENVSFDLESNGYTMLIIDTGGNHADMTDDYTSLEHEMKDVARALGGSVLREFSKEKVLNKIGELRTKVSDRAILRAIHFYDDDNRVLMLANALRTQNTSSFLKIINESGDSSWKYCQNCYSNKYVDSQGISIALALTENLLQGKGAYRVHGGGFAGTVQVFVPNEILDGYYQAMSNVFGESAIYQVIVRQIGCAKIEI
jgi:galactokinase